MENPVWLLARAEQYRRLMMSVTDDLALSAMRAMAEDLERRAALVGQKQTSPPH